MVNVIAPAAPELVNVVPVSALVTVWLAVYAVTVPPASTRADKYEKLLSRYDPGTLPAGWVAKMYGTAILQDLCNGDAGRQNTTEVAVSRRAVEGHGAGDHVTIPIALNHASVVVGTFNEDPCQYAS